MPFRRITIWGNSGSGKSALAERLARELELPAFHLDRVAWRAGWAAVDEAELLEHQRSWLQNPAWVIEGAGPQAALVERFKQADLIVFLKTSPGQCLARLQKRLTEERVSPSPFVAEGCRYADLAARSRSLVENFERETRPLIERMLDNEFAANPQLILDGAKPLDSLGLELARICRDLEPAALTRKV